MKELHPLLPFIPENARLLMLGSFPPPKNRWSIDFYYPNYINDMWRIMGLIFHDDKLFFVDSVNKTFIKSLICDFLEEMGIALYDTATEVVRLQNNASDKFLEIVKSTCVKTLFESLPHGQAIVTTGQKASEVVSEQLGINIPSVGKGLPFMRDEKECLFFRMPSSSRAYPMALEKKATFYASMFETLGML